MGLQTIEAPGYLVLGSTYVLEFETTVELTTQKIQECHVKATRGGTPYVVAGGVALLHSLAF